MSIFFYNHSQDELIKNCLQNGKNASSDLDDTFLLLNYFQYLIEPNNVF